MKATEAVYGLHAVRVMLERHPERVSSLALQAGRDDPRARQIEELARRHGLAVKRLDAQRFKQLLGDAAHQGVLAEITPLAPWSEEELLAALAELPQRPAPHPGKGTLPLLLALDGVQDPHNLGACLRTADACGCLAVIVPRDRAAQLNATARKVAAGAAETTPVVAVTNLVRTFKLLKEEAGFWVVGADAQAGQPAQEVDLKGPVVLALGSEGSGLRQLTRQHCDFLARLPQLGAVESLNVSVAAGMLLYEAVRQRQGAVKGSADS